MSKHSWSVVTTNAIPYSPGNEFCVILPAARSRTWVRNEKAAIEHASNLVAAGPADEFLVVKVVARVKRAKPLPPPVTVERVR